MRMMSKLKTAEDIKKKSIAIFQDVVNMKTLIPEIFFNQKHEAIKWIKAFRDGSCHTDFAADNRKGQENVEEWIEHFFNITDEDLK